jgi:hypothetical protein
LKFWSVREMKKGERKEGRRKERGQVQERWF